jgi:hypothetical protein
MLCILNASYILYCMDVAIYEVLRLVVSVVAGGVRGGWQVDPATRGAIPIRGVVLGSASNTRYMCMLRDCPKVQRRLVVSPFGECFTYCSGQACVLTVSVADNVTHPLKIKGTVGLASLVAQ